MAVLNARDRQFWEENGYVVIPAAVPQENLDAVIAAMQVFCGRNFANRDECYDIPRTPGSSLLNMMRHQSLWENRQAPRVHGAFAEILGTEELIVSQDRVAMNPPVGAPVGVRGLHPLGHGFDRAPPPSQAARGALPGRHGGGPGRLSMRARLPSQARGVGENSTPGPPPQVAGSHRARHSAHSRQGRRPAHLAQRPAPRQWAQYFGTPAPGPVHAHAPGKPPAREVGFYPWRGHMRPWSPLPLECRRLMWNAGCGSTAPATWCTRASTPSWTSTPPTRPGRCAHRAARSTSKKALVRPLDDITVEMARAEAEREGFPVVARFEEAWWNRSCGFHNRSTSRG